MLLANILDSMSQMGFKHEGVLDVLNEGLFPKGDEMSDAEIEE